MPITLTEENDGHVLVELPPALELRTAQSLKQALLEALARAGPLRIDAAAVVRVSTACVQILVAFVEAARQAGISVAFRHPSPPFLNALESLGLAPVTAHWKMEH